MIIDALKELFIRDLKKLREEINAYQDEQNLWKIEANIANSGGNLCLHLIGNLKAFIGAGFANSGYIRNRVNETSLSDIPKSELLAQIEQTITVVTDGFNQLEESDLDKNFPIVIWEHPTPMASTLIHLQGHLNYHLGQINYHRRLLDHQD
ncbi:MAG: DUF1572 family protein [Phaeodactylibacter sp.]|nr:DUF1572 family protein [Phaeodactylibacter sp.]